MNTRNSDERLSAFDALRHKRAATAIDFESKNSFEMAYVARWSVIETTVKHIFHAAACRALWPQIDEWYRFLNDPSQKHPSPIRSFPLDVSRAKIPTLADLKSQFYAAPNLLELLDPAYKFRKKRNSIAHSAEAFAQKSTYAEYKVKVEMATEELRQVLCVAKPASGPR